MPGAAQYDVESRVRIPKINPTGFTHCLHLAIFFSADIRRTDLRVYRGVREAPGLQYPDHGATAHPGRFSQVLVP